MVNSEYNSSRLALHVLCGDTTAEVFFDWVDNTSQAVDTKVGRLKYFQHKI